MSNFTLRDFIGVLKPIEIRNVDDWNFSGFSIDSRTVAKGDVFIALRGERYDGHAFVQDALARGAVACIVDRRVGDHPQIVVLDTWKALKNVALYLRKQFGGKVVGIVGSVGKTTTKELLSSILSSRFSVCKNFKNENNWIGVSKTLLQLVSEYDFCVTECGTNHPGEMLSISSVVRPDAVLFTPIAPVHIGNFGSMSEIVEEKLSILKCSNVKHILYDLDSGFIKLKGGYSYSVDGVADVYVESVEDNGFSYVIYVNAFGDAYKIYIENGFLHKSNVVGAVGMAKILVPDLKAEDIEYGLNHFNTPEYRMNVERVSDVTFVLDCYNASPPAVKHAVDRLSRLPGRKLIVMGDMLELGDKAAILHGEIGKYLNGRGIDVFAFGDLSRHIVSACDCRVREFFADKEELVSRLLEDYKKYSVVLIKGSRALRMEEIFSKFKEKII